MGANRKTGTIAEDELCLSITPIRVLGRTNETAGNQEQVKKYVTLFAK